MPLLGGGQISNFEGVIGGMPARSGPENFAGAVGFEIASLYYKSCTINGIVPPHRFQSLLNVVKQRANFRSNDFLLTIVSNSLSFPRFPTLSCKIESGETLWLR